MQVKGNPFVKQAPTTKMSYLMHQDDFKIRIVSVIKTNGVPYCDTFQIDEEWTVLGLGPQSKACVFRSTYAITMLKSTMMKSIICQNTQSESKKSWDAFTQWVYQTNQHQFIEKKRTSKSSTATH